LPVEPTEPETEALGRAKDELRARMRAQLRATPPAKRLRRASAAARLLVGLPQVAGARTVLTFSSFGSEIPTAPLIEALASDPQRAILLPYVEDGGLHATRYRPGDELVPTGYGPLEPARRAPVDPTEIDVAVVPGLAFDRHGRRLGRGGGFYDAYLARLPSGAVRIGFALREQLLERVPAGPADRPVDLVVTDGEVVDCHGGGPGTAR
jgi:5-formyltetrahydrofolate cyclo-ligase